MKQHLTLRQVFVLMYSMEAAGIVLLLLAFVTAPPHELTFFFIFALAGIVCVSVSMMFHVLSALVEIDQRLEQLVQG